MFALLTIFAPRTFAQTTVLTMDSGGNLSAVGNLTGSTIISQAGVAGGTYTSGTIATSGTGTCWMTLTGGTTSGIASVSATASGGAALTIVSPGQGYTSAPTMATVIGGGTGTGCSIGSDSLAGCTLADGASLIP